MKRMNLTGPLEIRSVLPVFFDIYCGEFNNEVLDTYVHFEIWKQ